MENGPELSVSGLDRFTSSDDEELESKPESTAARLNPSAVEMIVDSSGVRTVIPTVGRSVPMSLTTHALRVKSESSSSHTEMPVGLWSG